MVQHDRKGAYAGPVPHLPPRDPRRQRRHMPGAVRKHRTSRSQVTSSARNTMPRTVCACQPLRSAPSGTPLRATLAPRRCRFGLRCRGSRPFRRFPPSFPDPSAPYIGVSSSPRTDFASPDGAAASWKPDPGLQLPDQIRQLREPVVPFRELGIPLGKRFPKIPYFRNQRRMAGFSPAIRTRNVHSTVILWIGDRYVR